ncbi:MAG: hypothetical protein FWG98_00415 [Candidatus Cloacimonetes bacterium]|nr:hypothetical protein [Candidatus Cloacimonadota bacterium]
MRNSSKAPRKDGKVTLRLLRGEIQVRDLATTGCESSQGRESDTEIASGGDSSEGPRNDGKGNLARTGK